jgi:hypothetical protein
MIESGYIAIIAIMVLIVGFSWWVSVSQQNKERTLRREGIKTFATVLDVRDDRADFQTIIEYEFIDLNSGRSYRRSGVLQRTLPFPEEGDKIEIIYLGKNPKMSRLLFEENFNR